jgi:hypothetical protein
MEGKNAFTKVSAARLVASVFGVLAGVGGVTHGIGETRQGNVAPSGIVINSWTEGPIATNMGGEPGMTIIPNLLVTGVLTILVSLAVLVWAAAFVQRKNGGRVLILLSVGMLLVGGGFGPPITGILAGVAGTGIKAPFTWWRTHLPVNVRRFLAKLWPWIFGVSLVNGVFLFLGSVILVYFFGVNNPDLFVNSFFFVVVSLLLTIFTGIAYDLQASKRGVVVED